MSTIVAVSAQKQIKLEDIEKDTLASERKLKQEKSQKINQVKFQLGFPLRTTSFQQPLAAQPQIISLPPTYYNIEDQRYVNREQIDPNNQQRHAQLPPQIQPQYHNLEQVPYITSNQISSTSAPPQYYTQYVYLQPFTAPSNAIQMVVDAKGNAKYFEYVPTQYFSEVKATQTGGDVGPQIFTQEPTYNDDSSRYITQPQLPPQPHILDTQQVRYTPQPITFQRPEGAQTRYPQSLLESYVPSVLQLQYFKQQQAEANAIKAQEVAKSVGIKSFGVKSVLEKQLAVPSSASEYTYVYQVPPRSYTGLLWCYNTRSNFLG